MKLGENITEEFENLSKTKIKAAIKWKPSYILLVKLKNGIEIFKSDDFLKQKAPKNFA